MLIQAAPYWRSKQALRLVADILLDFAPQGEQGAVGDFLRERTFRYRGVCSYPLDLLFKPDADVRRPCSETFPGEEKETREATANAKFVAVGFYLAIGPVPA